MADEIIIETTSQEVVEIGVVGPQGPKGDKGDPGDVAGLPLTAQGDTLYRGASSNQRLPIGQNSQVLKVVNGLPAWANESGAVTSVNGATGAVTVAALNHTHEVADVFFQGLEILGAGNANTNGIYVYGGDLNGKGVYYKDKDTFVYWDGAAWTVSYNTNDIYSSAQNTTTPWAVTSWSVESGQTSPAPSSWDRLTGDQWEAVVGQRINPTLRGDAAGKNVGTGANDVAAGNDSRFTDARQPISHSSTHQTGGTDAIAAHQINGQTIFGTGSATYSTDQTLGAIRALQLTVSNTNASGINLTLPTQSGGTLNGDTYVVIGGSTVSGPITVRRIDLLSPLIYTTLATITATGQQYRFRASGGQTGGWSLVPVDTHTHTFGTTAGTFTQGNDARLSDSRTPTAHAASHAAGGSDPVFDQNLNTTDDVTFNTITINGIVANNGINGSGFPLNNEIRVNDTGSSNYADFVAFDSLTANRTYDLPDANGTLALISDIPSTFAASAITSGTLTHERGGLEADVSAYNGLVKISGGATSAVTVTATGESVIGAADAAAARSAISAAAASHTHELTALAATGATNGHVLTANGSGGVTFAAASGGGSGGTKTYAVFIAEHNQPPSTAFATLDTRNSIAVLDFDAATDENAVFVGIMPEGASLGSGLIVRLHWMATSATSGNVRWGVQFERSNTDLDADSFAAAVEANGAANGTSGILTTTAITVTDIDSIAAGDVFRLKVYRNADDVTHDTLSGDAELVACEVRSAA